MDVNDRRGGNGAIEGMDLAAAAAVAAVAAMEEVGGGDDDSSGGSSDDDGNSELGSVEAHSLLMQLQDDDPALTAICLTDVAAAVILNDASWRRIGQDIGRNTHLELVSFHTHNDVDFQSVFEGVAQNESIRDMDFLHLDTHDGQIFHCILSGDVAMLPSGEENNTVSSLFWRLRQLTIEDCYLGNGGFMALSMALDPPNGDMPPSLLEEINLDHICPEGRGDLVCGIIRSLKRHTKLEKISLRGNGIRVDGCVALSKVLFGNESGMTRLTTLDLGVNEIGQEGAEALVAGMIDGRCSVIHLNLDETEIGSRGRQSIARLLSDYPRLKCLSLNNPMDGHGADDLVGILGALGRNGTLTDLHLDRTSISLRELGALSEVLRSPQSRLRILSLRGNKIRNGGAILLAGALAENNTLLRMDIENDVSITSRGWKAFSSVLCFKWSIMATFQSNHTLQQLVGDEWTLSGELMSLLLLNREGNRREVARRKILKCHFSGKELDMQPFVDMPSGVLPHVIEWMGRGGMSPLYLFVRNMQSFFDVKGGQGALQEKGANAEDAGDIYPDICKIPREERLDPGGLDPVEVFESLPESMQAAFESREEEKLEAALRAMTSEEGEYHMKRCIDSGLWNA